MDKGKGAEVRATGGGGNGPLAGGRGLQPWSGSGQRSLPPSVGAGPQLRPANITPYPAKWACLTD